MALTGRLRPPLRQMAAMKRPSDVPPVVDSSGRLPVTRSIAAVTASTSFPDRSGTACRRQRPRRGRSPVRVDRAPPARVPGGRSTVLAVEKRKLNSTSNSPGITLVAPVPAWMLEICQVVGGKIFVARVPCGGGQFGQGGCGLMDRIAREVRIGDMALHAAHHEIAGERAAASVLDGVAEALGRRSVRRRCSNRLARRARAALPRLASSRPPRRLPRRK